MEYIQKLPFILSSLATIIVGMVSFNGSVVGRDIYLKMAVSMIVFYLLGMMLRSMIEKTGKELEEKKKLEEQQRLREEQEMAAKQSADEQQAEHLIDYRVDDDDEFSPFTVSEFINTKEK